MCPSSVLSPFSWVQILCDPMDCSPPGSSVHGILQARILEWVAMPSSRGSSRPRDWTWVSYVSSTGRRILYHSHHLGASVIPEWSTEWSALLLPGILVTSLSRPIFTVLNFLTWSFTVHMFFGLNFKLLWSQLIINLQREMAFLFFVFCFAERPDRVKEGFLSPRAGERISQPVLHSFTQAEPWRKFRLTSVLRPSHGYTIEPCPTCLKTKTWQPSSTAIAFSSPSWKVSCRVFFYVICFI